MIYTSETNTGSIYNRHTPKWNIYYLDPVVLYAKWFLIQGKTNNKILVRKIVIHMTLRLWGGKRKKNNATEKCIIVPFWIFKQYWIINWSFLGWKNGILPTAVCELEKTGCKKDWEGRASMLRSVYKKHNVICVPLQFRSYSLQTSTPKEKQPTSGCGPHLPALSPTPPSDKAKARGHPSSVCMCVREPKKTKGEKKGQEKEKAERSEIIDSPPDHPLQFWSHWTVLQ